MNRIVKNGAKWAAVAVTTVGLWAGAYPARAAIFTFQQGVNSYTGAGDTLISGDTRTGAAAQIQDNSATTRLAIFERESDINNLSRALLRFDNLGSPGTVATASLTVTLNTDNHGGQAGTWSLFALTPANQAWSPPTATWNNRNQSGPNPWAGSAGLSTPGVDYIATAIATIAIPTTSQPGGTPLVFNFSPAGVALINDWIANPGNNAGFMIRLNGSPDQNRNDGINSAEFETLSQRPLLTLVVPEPAAAVMVMMGMATMVTRRRRV